MGEAYAMDDTAVVRDIRERVGALTGDEAALVRTLTPGDLTGPARAEHLFDLVDLLTTIREDEAMAEYVYAIAPGWDGTIETLLLGGRVTTAFTRIELESCLARPAAGEHRASAPRPRARRVPATVA
jgi:hypothetical protein